VPSLRSPPVLLVEALGDDHRRRLADRLLGRVPEDPLRGLVPHGDDAVLVRHEHGVAGGVHDRPEPLFALSELLLRQLALRDVLGQAGYAQEVGPGVADRNRAIPNPTGGPVVADDAELLVELAEGSLGVERRDDPLPVVGVDELQPAARVVVEALARAAEDGLVGGARVLDAAAAGRGHRHDLVDVLGKLPEPGLAFAQAGLGADAVRDVPRDREHARVVGIAERGDACREPPLPAVDRQRVFVGLRLAGGERAIDDRLGLPGHLVGDHVVDRPAQNLVRRPVQQRGLRRVDLPVFPLGVQYEDEVGDRCNERLQLLLALAQALGGLAGLGDVAGDPEHAGVVGVAEGHDAGGEPPLPVADGHRVLGVLDLAAVDHAIDDVLDGPGGRLRQHVVDAAAQELLGRAVQQLGLGGEDVPVLAPGVEHEDEVGHGGQHGVQAVLALAQLGAGPPVPLGVAPGVREQHGQHDDRRHREHGQQEQRAPPQGQRARDSALGGADHADRVPRLLDGVDVGAVKRDLEAVQIRIVRVRVQERQRPLVEREDRRLGGIQLGGDAWGQGVDHGERLQLRHDLGVAPLPPRPGRPLGIVPVQHDDLQVEQALPDAFQPEQEVHVVRHPCPHALHHHGQGDAPAADRKAEHQRDHRQDDRCGRPSSLSLPRAACGIAPLVPHSHSLADRFPPAARRGRSSSSSHVIVRSTGCSEVHRPRRAPGSP
jgi:hypothetical protein